uniref:Uncharacterized protein n=1 Tax=Ciona savignyi TaxID=51511 RepID=H2ZN66_CIOSA
MSKRKSEDPHGGAKEGESEEEEGLFPPKVPRVATSTELPTEEQPGPSHRVFPVQRGEPVEFGAMRGLPQPSLRTRGPGRPRIHPPKPAGVSRPRGRPKGSKNKKPRKV